MYNNNIYIIEKSQNWSLPCCHFYRPVAFRKAAAFSAAQCPNLSFQCFFDEKFNLLGWPMLI